MDRRSLLQYSGATAFGALALTAVSSTASPAEATTGVRHNHFPKGLTPTERQHLTTFDELDFVVFSHAQWSRLGESHAKGVRVHMPDGKGGVTPPTGKKFAISMATVGIWNAHGRMDEEFLFWDNLTFYRQLGLL